MTERITTPSAAVVGGTVAALAATLRTRQRAGGIPKTKTTTTPQEVEQQ